MAIHPVYFSKYSELAVPSWEMTEPIPVLQQPGEILVNLGTELSFIIDCELRREHKVYARLMLTIAFFGWPWILGMYMHKGIIERRARRKFDQVEVTRKWYSETEVKTSGKSLSSNGVVGSGQKSSPITFREIVFLENEICHCIKLISSTRVFGNVSTMGPDATLARNAIIALEKSASIKIGKLRYLLLAFFPYKRCMRQSCACELFSHARRETTSSFDLSW